MKAIIWTKYGPPEVLQVQEVDKPIPKDNEILIRNYATTVTVGDCGVRGFKGMSGTIFAVPLRLYIGLLKPTRITILGQELAGEVEAVGKDVTLFKEGDPVFAATGFLLSAYAEYSCLPEKSMVALKPTNLTYEEAAAVPLGGVEAWQYLKKANIQPGQQVLVNGAGGTIGTFAVQIAKQFGAEVTAVDSADKLDMLHTIGADQVIDYAQEDFTKNGQLYDVIFDVIGSSSESRCAGSLKPGGQYLTANPGRAQQFRGLWRLLTQRKKKSIPENTAPAPKNSDLIFLKELIEAGKLKPVIDKIFSMTQAPEAHRYVETGCKQGNVVISLV